MLKIYAADIREGDYSPMCECIMSPGRLEKYRRIADDKARLQCAAAARLLKWALPNKTEYFDAAGKPFIDGGYISISHSEDMVLLAVSDTPVGVDIELEREVHPKVAQRMFSSKELASGYPIMQLWVRKEAMLKKLGTGLKGAENEITDHEFLSIPHFEGYAAAVCTDQKEYQMEII